MNLAIDEHDLWLRCAFTLLQDFDLMKTYVLKIQELEGELIRLKSLNSSKRSRFSDFVDSDDDETSKNSLFSSGNDYSSSGKINKVVTLQLNVHYLGRC